MKNPIMKIALLGSIDGIPSATDCSSYLVLECFQYSKRAVITLFQIWTISFFSSLNFLNSRVIRFDESKLKSERIGKNYKQKIMVHNTRFAIVVLTD